MSPIIRATNPASEPVTRSARQQYIRCSGQTTIWPRSTSLSRKMSHGFSRIYRSARLRTRYPPRSLRFGYCRESGRRDDAPLLMKIYESRILGWPDLDHGRHAVSGMLRAGRSMSGGPTSVRISEVLIFGGRRRSGRTCPEQPIMSPRFGKSSRRVERDTPYFPVDRADLVDEGRKAEPDHRPAPPPRMVYSSALLPGV